MLESHWPGRLLQINFSTRPNVSPVLLAARAKGRLQHACSRLGLTACAFSRKLAVRSLGDNTRAVVEAYIQQQAARSQYADERFKQYLKQFTATDPAADLAAATPSASGRYWYNLHLVLTVVERWPITRAEDLARIREGCFRAAAMNEHRASHVSVMPDHLHVALRGDIQHSPDEIALGILNGLSGLLQRGRIWNESYYVGTFSEYDMGVIRRRPASQPISRPGQASWPATGWALSLGD